jgi:hypothetical protein
MQTLALSSLSRLALFTCVVVASSAFGAPATEKSPATPAGAPPWLPDSAYVANGCYISATAYVARLIQLDASWRGAPVQVTLPDGSNHTIARVLSPAGEYGRDQYIGVFAIEAGDVQASFTTALDAWKRSGGKHPYRHRMPGSTAQRKQEVQLAKELLPEDGSDVVSVKIPGGTAAILTWRTLQGELAIYEPSFGTALTQAKITPAEFARHVLMSWLPRAVLAAK